MNFVKCSSFVAHMSKTQVALILFLAILLSIYLVGCSEQVRLCSAEQLAEFESAGPICPAVDVDRLVRARIGGGPYRVVPGDVLELTMPTILRVVTAERPKVPEQVSPYICRVSTNGTITLPIVGETEAAGKCLAEIESAVVDAYHPKYAVIRPAVFARVTEYATAKVSITGAVQKPGVYSLRSDQMSLVALLMEAGGIIDEGAARIRIIHSDEPAPDHKQAPIRTAEETVGQLAELNETEAVVSPTHHPNHNQIDVQLTFEQITPSSTIGGLTIMKPDETILLAEQLDITSEVQRLAVLEKLDQRQPYVSTAEVGQRLCALAELLKPGSGMYNSESESTNRGINSHTKLNGGNSNRRSTQDEALDKELLEIRNLEKSPQIVEETMLGRPGKREPIVLPVKGLNIPFADVALRDGDSVIVERLEQPLFTVIGLVNRPGNFPYPPDVQYNLVQAIGFAGGLDRAADPRYVTVYRLKSHGTTVSATFKVVDGSKLTDALNTLIKPGDIVAVEHTPRTRTNLFLDRVFRINFGIYTPFDVFNRWR